MLDRLRTLLASLIVQRFTRPRPLVVQAWLWLAADTDDVEEKWPATPMPSWCTTA